jgi:hypothetical protein
MNAKKFSPEGETPAQGHPARLSFLTRKLLFENLATATLFTVISIVGAVTLMDISSVNVLMVSALVFFVVLITIYTFVDLVVGVRGFNQQRAAAEVLEAKAENQETLVDYVEAKLVAAAARQELAVCTAEGRANRLSSVGIILMVSSVLVPFALVYLYMILPATVPATPPGAAPQRDWHLLFAGLSFGLLFIAAARGILLAEGRQREVYAREVRETAYYGDLRRALGMAQRLDVEDQETTHAATREIVRKIMSLMLERGGRDSMAVPTAETSPGNDHEFFKIVADAIKK